MVKVMAHKLYPRLYGREHKGYWIKPPYTKVEERILDEWWDQPEKWPKRYPEDWYICAHEGTPEAFEFLYGLNKATSLTFYGGAPHRPSSPAQPAPAPADQKSRKEPAP